MLITSCISSSVFAGNMLLILNVFILTSVLLLLIVSAIYLLFIATSFFQKNTHREFAQYRNSRLHILSFVTAIFTVLFVVALVPPFEELFVSFGGALPGLTESILKYRWLFVLAPILAIASLWKIQEIKSNTLFAVSLFSVEIFLAILLVQSMYLPIFRMGCVV